MELPIYFTSPSCPDEQPCIRYSAGYTGLSATPRLLSALPSSPPIGGPKQHCFIQECFMGIPRAGLVFPSVILLASCALHTNTGTRELEFGRSGWCNSDE